MNGYVIGVIWFVVGFIISTVVWTVIGYMNSKKITKSFKTGLQNLDNLKDDSFKREQIDNNK